ncbi:gliding motility-associated C-terminal domain-containing protein [Tamlana sp. I1]|uniref:HYR-like domain-containing protein n=1 Tax=Tamlana sp. I1 TaxID=2762061 RepID=UPI00188E3342|nr:gliding motility-associated C-terminal domain-containing protein [Tamlana sp. I1]
MKNNYNCISVLTIKKALIIAFFVMFPTLIFAQTNAPSIRSGVTFGWSDTQGANDDIAATIQSITVNGTVYNSFVVPTGYSLDVLGVPGDNDNKIRKNNTRVINTSLNRPLWNARALEAFQDKNLNHYFTANRNGDDICNDYNSTSSTSTIAQRQSIHYDPAIPSNAGGLLGVTERGGNNCFYIEVYGYPKGTNGGTEVKLGSTFVRNLPNRQDYESCDSNIIAPVDETDYWKSDRCNDNGQSIAIALYYLDELAETGSLITRIEFVGATADHGDGKFFLIQKYAVDQQPIECLGNIYNGDLKEQNSAPAKTKYELISGPDVAGAQPFEFHPDGTYTYYPTNGFMGEVNFTYKLCLVHPNDKVCEEGTVKLNYVALPPEPKYAITCNSADNFTLEITEPVSSNAGEYEYSIDNGVTYQSSTTFSNLPEGSYSLKVKSGLTSCEKTNATNPVILTNLGLSGIATGITCSADTTASIDITVTGGATPYSFMWSNSATTEDLSNIGKGTYTVTVTDANGCTISDSFTVDGDDETAPTITSPANETIEGCGTDALAAAGHLACSTTAVDITLAQLQAAFDGTGTASDNTGGKGIKNISYKDTESGTCPIIVTRTYTVIDNCDNTSSSAHTITIDDTTPPSGTAPTGVVDADVCYNDAQTNYPFVANTIASNYTDSCTNPVTVNLTNTALTGDDCAWTLIYTYEVVDDCDNKLENQTITHTGKDQTKPVIDNSSLSNIVIDCGKDDPSKLTNWLASHAGATATDNCSTITWTNNYGGDTSTQCLAAQPISVIFTATDSCGNKTDITATYTIQDVTPPNITTAAANKTVACDGSGNTNELNNWLTTNGGAQATDECSTIKWTNNYASISDGCAETGSVSVTFTATDACGNSENTTATFTIEDKTNPTWTVEPTDATVECDASNSTTAFNAWLGSFSGTDTCGTATVTHNSNGLSDLCGSTGTEAVTFTLEDECGNKITKDATFTIEDKTNPTWTVEPADATVECDASDPTTAFNAWLSSFSGTDTCGTATVTHNSNGLSDLCGSTGTETVTFTLEDECGNKINKDATFTIEDKTKPTWTVEPTDAIVECDASDTTTAFNAWLSSFSGTDTCGTATVTHNSNGLSDLCGSTGTETVTFTLEDECGNKITKDATFTIEDKTNPTWTVEPTDATVECDASNPTTAFNAWLSSFSGTDNCGTATVTHNSNGLSDLCGSTGTETVTFTLEDECGNKITKEATFTIEDTTAPIIDNTNIADIEIICGSGDTQKQLTDWLNSNAGATATDSCSSIKWSNDYDGDNRVKCKLEKGIRVNFTAEDECGNTSVTSALFHIKDDIAPTITKQATSLTVECDGSGNIADLNAWLTSNAGATVTEDCSVIVWSNNYTSLSDDCGETGSATVTFTATDSCGNYTETTATFTIEDTLAPNAPSTPADVAYQCLSDVPAPSNLTANDNCSGTITALGVDSVDNSNPCKVLITRTWTFTDDCNNATSIAQTITVEDTAPPVLDLPVNVSAQCSDDLSPISFGTATATDNCDPNPVITFNDVRTDGACSGTYSITRTWTATDSCGNTVSANQIISTSDTTAPVFDQTSLPADVVVECDGIPAAETLTASDNCGSATVTVDELRIDGNCPSNYILKRTYTATDDCGITNTHVQTITVQDTTAPTFVDSLPATTLIVECDAVPTAETLTATDICGSATVSVNDTRTNGNCANNYTLTRTWTAVDECGLTTTHTQIITVQDTTAPQFVETLPRDVTVECDNIPVPAIITATDNCGDAKVTSVDVRTNGTCINNYTITRTWTAVDECGLTATHTQLITVEDTTAPVPSTSFETVLDVSCTDIPEAPNMTFADNCSSNITVDFNETNSFDENNFVDYEIIRTWLVTDECNNSETYTQTLNVTLDEIYTEIVAPDTCFQDGIVDLQALISEDLNTKGTWEIVEGTSAATLNGNLFDPTIIKMSEEFLPGSGGINYRFRYTTTNNGCISVSEIVMNLHADCIVLPCGENDIQISTAITPNGDGYNDTFDIKGIDLCGFVAEVKVFNRWGALVYESNNYTLGSIETSGAKGDWDGSAPSSSIGSKGKLPTGTYYYIINLKNSGLSPLTGPVYIGTK